VGVGELHGVEIISAQQIVLFAGTIA